jgi:hypothetical protein
MDLFNMSERLAYDRARTPITDEELAEWAAKRADDAGWLARELVLARASIRMLGEDRRSLERRLETALTELSRLKEAP